MAGFARQEGCNRAQAGFVLAAEAAAQIRTDHSDLFVPQVENSRQFFAVAINVAARLPHGELVVLPPGEAVARFEGQRAGGLGAIGSFDDDLGFAQPALDITPGKFNGRIAGQVRTAAHRRRIGFESGFGVEHKGQGAVLDIDQPQRFCGDLFAISGHGRHLIADMAHGPIEHINRRHRPFRTRGAARFEGIFGRVLVGDDCAHPRQRLGLCRVEGDNLGVGKRATQGFAVQQAFCYEAVGGESRRSRDLLSGIRARYGSPDYAKRRQGAEFDFGHSECRVARNATDSRASRTTQEKRLN